MEISRLISQLRIGKFGKSNSRHKSSDNLIAPIIVVIIALFCQILSCNSSSINYHFLLDHLFKKAIQNIVINLHIYN